MDARLRWLALTVVAACTDASREAPAPFLLGLPADGAIVTPGQLTFSWSPASGATGYVLDVDGAAHRELPAVTSFAADFTLAPGTTYVWHVSATGPAGTTAAGNAPFAFTTPPEAPAAFQLVAPAADATTGLAPQLRWTASPGARRFELQITAGDFDAPDVEMASIAPEVTSLVLDAPLTPGTRYFWRVLAHDSVSVTTASNAPAAFTTATLPGPFALMTPADGAMNVPLTPMLTWSASGGADGYTVELDDGPGVEVAGTSWAPSPLSPATQHSWRVLAHNAQGTREASATFTTGAPPGAFSVTAPVDGSVEASIAPMLSWSPSANATSYSVQLGLDRALSAPVFEDDAVTGQTVTVMPALIPATTYYWRVIALNAVSTAAASGVFTTSPPPTSPMLAVPFNGALNVKTATSFIWTPVLYADRQTLEVATDSAFTAIAYRNTSLPGTATGATASPPLAGSTTYYWRVTAYGPAGTAAATNAPFAFTTGPVPTAFMLLTPADAATAVPVQPTLTWSAATGQTGYQVQIATEPTFTAAEPLISEAVAGTSFTLEATCPLTPATTYYWRVLALSATGSTVASNAPFSFTTQASGPGGTLLWAVSHPSAAPVTVSAAFALDATGVYVSGVADDLLHFEKRRLADGSVIFDQSEPAGFPTPAAIVLGASTAWIVSNEQASGTTHIIIEARDLTSGAFIDTFGSHGLIVSNETPDSEAAAAAVADSSSLYVAGSAGSSWYVEKRSLATGALDPAFGTAGFIQSYTMGYGPTDVATGIALLPPHILVLGRETLVDPDFGFPLDTTWRLEARLMTDGSLDPAFADAGFVDVNPSSDDDNPGPVIVDGNALYLGGGQASAAWTLAKADPPSGALVSGFANAGVASELSTGFKDQIFSIAGDGTALYSAGRAAQGHAWRVEARDEVTGAFVPSWGATGVVQCVPAAFARTTAVAADSSGIYVLGNVFDTSTSGFRWRIEKRQR